MKRLFAGWLILLSVCSVQAQKHEIHILAVNDMHANIDAHELSGKSESDQV